MLEMLFTVVMFFFFGYCLYHVSTTVEVSTVTDPLGAAFWPQLLIGLLLIVLALDMYHVYKAIPKEDRSLSYFIKYDWLGLIKSPLVVGMVVLFIYALVLNSFGFLLSSWVLGMIMCYLLGERRLKVLPIFSFVAVGVLFILFYKGIGIQMPRGTIPVLRNFALDVERMLRIFG